MGTTLSTTIGWGFPLTSEDIKNFAKNLPAEVWKGYDSALAFTEECGEYDTLDSSVGYGTPLNLFDVGMSAYYDYYDDEPYYIYLKRATQAFYDSGFHQISRKKPKLTRDEAGQLVILEAILGRDVELTPFAETSIG